MNMAWHIPRAWPNPAPRRARSSVADYTLRDRARFSSQSPQQPDLPVVITLVISQLGERGLDGTRQRRAAQVLWHGKSQRLIGNCSQGRYKLLLRVGQQAAERAQVKDLVAGMNWIRAAPIVCGAVDGQNGTTTGQGQHGIAGSNDVTHDPVDAVAGGFRDEQALLLGDAVEVAVDGSVAEFVHAHQVVAGHVVVSWEGIVQGTRLGRLRHRPVDLRPRRAVE